jgi:hypothetical protein
MQDEWYGDKRDLIKWATLLEVARLFNCEHLLLVLYYTPTIWKRIQIDGQDFEIPNPVIKHFRDCLSVRTMECNLNITALDRAFDNADHARRDYTRAVVEAIHARVNGPGIVFLDPDTGLEPPTGKFGATHVRESEVSDIWSSLKRGDVLVLYQHETNRKGEDFIGPKRSQLANAIDVEIGRVKYAHAPEIAKDVAYLFAAKG